MRQWPICAALAILGSGAASPGWGQGSAVMANSSCAMGVAGAGVAAPCDDGSAVLFNPAALAHQRSTIGFGVSGVRSSGYFAYDRDRTRVSREGATAWTPYGYLNFNITPSVSAALGAFTPYWVGVGWPETFEGRFVSHESNLSSIYLQPTLAYAPVPRVSFGLGLDVIFSHLQFSRRFDLATTELPFPTPGGSPLTFGDVGVPAETDFADLRLDGRGVGATFHVALLARATDRLTLGVRYLHGAVVRPSGDAEFAPVLTDIILPPGNPLSAPGNPFGLPPGSALYLDPLLAEQFITGGPLASQPFEVRLKLPGHAVLGAAFAISPAARLRLDYLWTGWESFDRVPVTFEHGGPDTDLVLDYRNTTGVRVGAEYAPIAGIQLRGGYGRSSGAQPTFSVSPLFPEGDRAHYSAGLGWAFRDRMRLDVAYQFLHQGDRRGRVAIRGDEMTDEELERLNVGVYASRAHIVGATFSYQFGPVRTPALQP